MKIVVTGGAGFIGSHLVRRLLDEGHEVGVIDNFTDFYAPGIKRANVESFGGRAQIFDVDITDFAGVQRILAEGKFDAIAHLAARAGVRPSIEDPRGYIETNVTGTYNLLEGARAAGTNQFIFASSSSVYGLAKTVPFSEELALPQTLSPYAATKLAGEQLCGNFSYLHGMRVVCLRFFTVYGPGQRPDLAIYKFTDMIERGEAIPKFGDGGTRRDYTYIDDIVQGVLGAIAYRDEPFAIFNLGESETTTLNELIAALENALGKKAAIRQLPEQKGDMPLTCADISKARRLLGYDPRTKIAEGIPKFVEWYRGLKKS
ncbi:MAG: SDR family NAD(P)-dependent oxidoreductase [Terrimicrobiaceae bacterium]|nr:SDR family NAD(P)-dependent oxidoreductase [Terrimicrobiaceae bacterium]